MVMLLLVIDSAPYDERYCLPQRVNIALRQCCRRCVLRRLVGEDVVKMLSAARALFCAHYGTRLARRHDETNIDDNTTPTTERADTLPCPAAC